MNVLLPNLGKFGITASFGIVYVFGGELLPTVVRGNGLATCSFISSVGLVASPYIVYLVRNFIVLLNSLIIRSLERSSLLVSHSSLTCRRY